VPAGLERLLGGEVELPEQFLFGDGGVAMGFRGCCSARS
jgi:hypothetical protein